VEIVAVVLDDGTAIGEESAIAPIFERRARERDALAAVTSVFSDVLASQHGTAALDALKQRLVALPARGEAPCRAAIDAVDTYRQRGGARTSEQLDESLRTYAAFVAREYELAKKHSQRRQ
jgi:alkylhydroperoxidase family enzyme